MTGKKIGKQSFEELTEMIKAIQEKEKIQDSLVRKFQKIIREEGLYSPFVRNFPYPMAIFKQDGDLVFVNSALSEETGLYTSDLSRGKHSLINRITNANLPILDAVEHVFMGETTFSKNLIDPLAIFISEKSSRKKSGLNYQSAVFFQVIVDKEQIIHGAVIFIK